LAANRGPPPETEYLWHHFLTLHATRPYSGEGPSRLTRLEIHAWQADEGVPLLHWERRAILAIDAAWVAAAHAQQADAAARAKSEQK